MNAGPDCDCEVFICARVRERERDENDHCLLEDRKLVTARKLGRLKD